MKRLFIISVLLVTITQLKAQQVPMYSQYTLNNYVINPAVAGTNKYFLARLSYRNQWTGFAGAPQTGIVSGHGLLDNKQSAVGGLIYNDVSGIFSRTGFQGTYAHHLEINQDMKVSLGLSIGAMQYRVNKDDIKTYETDDKTISELHNTFVFPDADAGAYLWGKDFYVGLSSLQLIQSKIGIAANDQSLEKSKIFRHFYLHGGYKYPINEDFAIEPNVLVKYVSKSPVQVDLNVRGNYHNVWWLGVSYRTNKEIVIQTELRIKEYWILGYSYDIFTSSKPSFNNGSYGIILGYNFGKDDSRQRKFR